MIFNAKIPQNVDIDGVTFVFKQMTASEHAEHSSRLSKIDSVKDMIDCAHAVMDNALVDVIGLVDLNGREIKPPRENGVLLYSFTDGFTTSNLSAITNAIMKAGQLPDDLKKN